MKKGLLLLVSMLMMVSIVGAMESTKHGIDNPDYNPFYDNHVIEFKERGIKFYVFLNGEFDFNTARTAHVDYVYRNGRRTVRNHRARGIRIERDFQGHIRRIGDVFISYTWNDKIKRIGSVFVKYNHNRMKRVGNLKIVYNEHRIRFVGRVKGHNHYYNPYYSYGWSSFNNWHTWDTWEYGYYDTFFYDNEFYNNYESFDEDDDFYYYRSKRNGKKGTKAQKGKVIKRKKEMKSKRNESRRKAVVPQRILSKHKRKS